MADIIADLFHRSQHGLFGERFNLVTYGDNVLIRRGGYMALLKYESHKVIGDGKAAGDSKATSRDKATGDSKATGKSKDSGENRTLEITGSHCLEFIMDPELDIYLPNSTRNEFVFDLSDTTEASEFSQKINHTYVSADYGDINSTLKSALPEKYFHEVILSFMEKNATKFCLPKWSEQTMPFTLYRMIGRFAYKTEKINHGDFLYIASKEHVFFLGAVKDKAYHPEDLGVMLPSTRPPLYFSNACLALKPMYIPSKRCVCLEIPEFKGKPFIFPSMGRSQSYICNPFKAEPEIITGNRDEALEHFKTTDFAEFENTARIYANSMASVHPSFAMQKSGKYFF